MGYVPDGLSLPSPRSLPLLVGAPGAGAEVAEGGDRSGGAVPGGGDELAGGVLADVAGSKDAGDGRAHPGVHRDVTAWVHRDGIAEGCGVRGEPGVDKDPGTLARLLRAVRP